jgi:pimeloyl-ACP methyl ester carboxylesterase
MSDRGLSDAARAWAARGRREEFRGHSIHVFEAPGDGPVLLMLHGFPSSSFDWRALLDRDLGHAVLAPDFLGFGLSDKPRHHLYSLFWQADLVESLAGRVDRPAFIVAHDMGTSVATELLARDLEGRLGFDLCGALLFNGSIVLDRASLTLGQRLLRGPLGGVFARVSSERFFRRALGEVFSDRHPLTDAEAADQWSLVRHNGGQRIGHLQVHYLDERERYADRWHGAIREWPGPFSLTWGTEDPVATTAVLDAVVALRPGVPVRRLEGLGHYPQIEDPDAVAAAVGEAVARAA